ncbi:DUF4493 domain-containing protein [Parabacteroides sp.]
MKIKKIYTVLLLAWLGLTACQQENLSDPVKGGFSVSLTEATTGVETKATPGDLEKPVTEKFKLLITNKTTGREFYNGAFTNQTISASVGTYTVKATCSPNASYEDNPLLALDAPYYEGTADATVKADETVSVNIPCKVANALASIRFGNNKGKFEDMFSAYGVEVKIGSQSVILRDSLQSAYYQAGSDVKFFFKGTLKGNNQEVSQELTHSEFNKAETFIAGSHCVINLSVEKTTSGVILTVAAAEVRTETITATIPMEWLPKPKIAGFANGETSLSYVETADAIPARISFAASSEIQDVEFSFDFQDEHYVSLNNKTYTLTTLSNEDKAAFTKASIIIPILDGSAEGSMDFTSMTANLQTNAGAETVNTIKLRVKANNRWSDQGTYEIRTQKPIFRVSAYPGNIWTKEFTMNALMEDQVETGNFNKLAEDMTYQYKSDKTDWETLGTDLRKTGLQPGTMYYIRGIYRGKIEGEVSVVRTYSEVKLENGGLEGATISKGNDNKLATDYGALYVWPSWATLNDLTCEYAAGAARSFNSRSGSRPSTDIPSASVGKNSVWISTIGYGYGGTSYKKISPGELFLGVYNTKGIEYTSHPTGVRFSYKYAPFKGDKSDIFVQVLSGDILLGEGMLQETSTINTFSTYTMEIVYDQKNLNLEPDKLIIVFKSGFNQEVEKRGEAGVLTVYENPAYRGSELYIDDVSLVYDK